MNVHNTVAKYLSDCGLFPSDGDAIIDEFKKTETAQLIKDRWLDDSEGYPRQFFAVLLLAVDAVALAWIRTNCPNHWAKTYFEGNVKHEPQRSQ